MESIETEICSDPGKRERKGRRMLGSEEWGRLMSLYDVSGLTQEAFCDREGVNYHTFIAWLGRRKRGELRAADEPVQFQELRLGARSCASSLTLEVSLPCGTLVRGSDAAELARMVRLLRS